jgi:hypothetical protein
MKTFAYQRGCGLFTQRSILLAGAGRSIKIEGPVFVTPREHGMPV